MTFSPATEDKPRCAVWAAPAEASEGAKRGVIYAFFFGFSAGFFVASIAFVIVHRYLYEEEESKAKPGSVALKARVGKSRPKPKPVPKAAKLIRWTFDDHPNKSTDLILGLLKRYKIAAVFFVNGALLATKENRERLRRIHDAGHMIGNHLWSHASPCLGRKRWRNLTRAQTLRELKRTRERIFRVLTFHMRRSGYVPARVYRAPFGDWCHTGAIKARGYLIMSWNVMDIGSSASHMWRLLSHRISKGKKTTVLIHSHVGKLKFLLKKVYGR